jgi:two-component system, OmpR family, sensor kinase
MLNTLRSIRFRLTFWFVSILAIAILIASLSVYIGLRRALLGNVDQTLRRAAERSVQAVSQDQLSTTNSARTRAQSLTYLTLAPTRLVLFDGSTTQRDPLFPADMPIDASALDSAARGESRYESVVLRSGQYRLLTAPVSADGNRFAIIQVAQSLETELATLDSLRDLLLIVVPVTLMFATVGGIILGQRAFAPMERVRHDVEIIIDDTDLSRRVGARLPGDEVGRLARTFDRLLERIQSALNRERQFAADASHELRSPLTALKGELSVALSRERSAADYKDVLVQLEASVDDMSVMVEDLLALSRASAGVMRVEAFDLDTLLEQVIERMHVLAEHKAIVLSMQRAARPISISADRMKLQRVLTNLVDNAIRYTPPHGLILLHARLDALRALPGRTPAERGTHVCIDVRDSGIGIAPEHLPHVFERFYRADNARTRDGAGGSGLGLAIADAIIRAHGGRITVESKLGQGSTFSTWLPRDTAPAGGD